MGLGELAENAERDVLEVADRRRADREGHQARRTSASARRRPERRRSCPAAVPALHERRAYPRGIGTRASRSLHLARGREQQLARRRRSHHRRRSARGRRVLTRLARPEPSLRPISVRSSSAVGSPSCARRTRRCASAAEPKASGSKLVGCLAGHVRLEVPVAAAAAGEAVVDDDDVPELRTGTDRAAVWPPTEDQTAADAGAQREHDLSSSRGLRPRCHSAIAAALPSLSIADGKRRAARPSPPGAARRPAGC